MPLSEQIKNLQKILLRANERYENSIALVSALGPGSLLLIDQFHRLNIMPDVLTIDTGYLFAETNKLRQIVSDRYNIKIKMIKAKLTVTEYEQQHTEPLYNIDPNQCCSDRKTAPLKTELKNYQAWISGIRHDQTSLRAQTPLIANDHQFNLIKISPLIQWSREDVWSYLKKHAIPYNPLLDQGYKSIGCWPCTQKPKNTESPREGRWHGRKKDECGLHYFRKNSDHETL